MLSYDEETSRRVEDVYTTAGVIEQRQAVLEQLALQPGERVLDVGVGPGFLAADMAAAVGQDGLVCGIDPSDSMLALAGRRAVVPLAAPLQLQRGDACHVPYPDGSFDVVVSTQVLEYVDDIPAALAEIRRVLRPGGRVLLLDTDWDSIVWSSSDEARTRAVLHAWEQHLADPHLPRRLAGCLERAGFVVTSVRALTLLNVGFEPRTYSTGLLDLIVAFVAGRDGLGEQDAQAWAVDVRSRGRNYFFSLNRYIICATTAAEMKSSTARSSGSVSPTQGS